MDVKKELSCFFRWKDLGLNLGLYCLTLEAIERDYRSTNERLEAVLTEWLRMNYDIEEYGLPSWRQLADAVEPIDHALAIVIKEQHPQGICVHSCHSIH